MRRPGRTRIALVIVCVMGWAAAATAARSFGVWPAIGSAAIALGLFVLITDSGSRSSLTLSPRLLLVGLAAGVVMTGATYLLYPPLVLIWPFIAADTGSLYGAFRTPSPLVAALALPLVVAGEELIWRGAVQDAFVHRFGGPSGIVLAALAYALAIAPIGSPVLMAVSLTCGLAWGALRAATHSLAPSLIAHLLWDLVVLLWWPLDAIRQAAQP